MHKYNIPGPVIFIHQYTHITHTIHPVIRVTLKASSKPPLCVATFAFVIVFVFSPIHWIYTNLTVGISSTLSN